MSSRSLVMPIPDAPTSFSLQDLAFIGGPFVTYLLTRWNEQRKAKREAEKKQTAADISEVVSPGQQAILNTISALRSDIDQKFITTNERVRELEWLVTGREGRGGLLREHEAAERRQRQYRDGLLYVMTLLTQVYRKVTDDDPPAPPPSFLE